MYCSNTPLVCSNYRYTEEHINNVLLCNSIEFWPNQMNRLQMKSRQLVRALRISPALLMLILSPLARGDADRVHTGDFTVDGLLNGSEMNETECLPRSNSLWLLVDGKGECIRYFHAGLDEAGENKLVHVWLHGDRLKPKWSARIGHGKPVGNEPIDYEDHDPALLQSSVDGNYASFAIPFIRLSRPGTYGSSGDHRQRRRPREIELISAAVDALKKRYQIKSFLLSGHSGGGHLVASLLPRRLDLACVVIASGMVSIGERVRLKGWNTDVTGYDDYVDPITLVDDIPRVLNRPILLVGDPRDSEVWFESQHSYFMRVHRAGHRVFLLSAKAASPEFHELRYLGMNMVRWCAEGKSVTDMIASTKFITESVKPDRKKYNDRAVTASSKD
jgi:hypothetical protein